MKKRVLLTAALAGVFYLQSIFAWASNPPQPDQKSTQIHDQQHIPGMQPEMQQKRTGNDAKLKRVTANTGKEQGPAPVILQIRVVNTPSD